MFAFRSRGDDFPVGGGGADILQYTTMSPPGAFHLVVAAVFVSSTQAAASSSGSRSAAFPSSHGPSDNDDALWGYRCRMLPVSELVQNSSSPIKPFRKCNHHCPLTSAPDLKAKCFEDHSFHDAYAVFTEHQSYRPQMQWNIFFICMVLAMGSLVRMFVPLPYTVVLLVLSIALGYIAEVRPYKVL